MITNSNRAYFDKMLGCGLQEEVQLKVLISYVLIDFKTF